MQFTSPLSINACRERLFRHSFAIPVLADTEIGISPTEGDHSQFVVRRTWKGMSGALRYGVMEVAGTLQWNGNQTDVTAQLQLKAMGYVSIVAMILLFLFAFSNTQ